MLEQVHQHIVGELQQNARTDTIFIVTAVVFNLIVLGINSGVASEASARQASTANDIILAVFIAMSLLVNGIAVIALNVGKQSRGILLNGIAVIALNVGKQSRGILLKGLLAMYQDNQVSQYYDASLLTNYNKRYLLFTAVIVCLTVTAIAVPLIIRLV